MNKAKRAELSALDDQLRAILKRVGQLKYGETHDHFAKSPNGSDHHPLTWAMLDNAHKGLTEAIVWVSRARLASRFGSNRYEMTRNIDV